jgi:hypothetical protein
MSTLKTINIIHPSGSTNNIINGASGDIGLGVTPTTTQLNTIQSTYGALTGNSEVNIAGNAYYNSGWKYVGTGLATQYRQSAGVHYWSTAVTGTAGGTISFAEAMRIDSSGNVGIGTASPGALLELSAANASVYSAIRLTNTTASGTTPGAGIEWARAGTVKSSITANTYGNDYMAFNVNGNTERARIDTTGSFLFNCTNPAQTVDPGFKVAAAGVTATVTAASTAGTNFYHLYSTGAAAYRFYVGAQGTIFATTTTISGISDQRLKENVRDLDVGLDAIMSLKPRKFDWKEGKGKNVKDDRGFIAQEFEQVFPDLIDEWKDEESDGGEPYKAVRADLIPVLVRAIQEQQATITALTARVAALEAK